jgi:hypothetical protein
MRVEYIPNRVRKFLHEFMNPEAREQLRIFWSANERRADLPQALDAIDKLIAMGLFPEHEHRPMPKLIWLEMFEKEQAAIEPPPVSC